MSTDIPTYQSSTVHTVPDGRSSAAFTSASASTFCSRRTAPGRSGPAPLRAGRPGTRTLRSWHEDAAAVVAVGDRSLGGLADALHLGGRDREVTALAGAPDQPCHADASRLSPAAVVLG